MSASPFDTSLPPQVPLKDSKMFLCRLTHVISHFQELTEPF